MVWATLMHHLCIFHILRTTSPLLTSLLCHPVCPLRSLRLRLWVLFRQYLQPIYRLLRHWDPGQPCLVWLLSAFPHHGPPVPRSWNACFLAFRQLEPTPKLHLHAHRMIRSPLRRCALPEVALPTKSVLQSIWSLLSHLLLWQPRPRATSPLNR